MARIEPIIQSQETPSLADLVAQRLSEYYEKTEKDGYDNKAWDDLQQFISTVDFDSTRQKWITSKEQKAIIKSSDYVPKHPQCPTPDSVPIDSRSTPIPMSRLAEIRQLSPLTPLGVCLRGIFTVEANGSEWQNAISFMDRYSEEADHRYDLDLTLRYCSYMAQLASHLQTRKDDFVRLHQPMAFRVQFGDEEFTSTCHLIELILSVYSLGPLVCAPVLNCLPMSARPSVQGGRPASLALTCDLELTTDELRRLHSNVRRVIGLFHYCVTVAMPQATAAVGALNEQVPGFSDSFRSSYHCIRALGCWVAASSLSPPGLKEPHLASCQAIVQHLRQLGLPLPPIANTLDESSDYERQLMLVEEWMSNGEDDMALCLLERTQSRIGARKHHLDDRLRIERESKVSSSGWSGSTYSVEHIDDARRRAMSMTAVNRDALRLGQSPTLQNVFGLTVQEK